MAKRKILRFALLGLPALLVVIQLVPYGRAHANPAVRSRSICSSVVRL